MCSDAPVHIVSYDRNWPSKFEAERRLLVDAIGPWLVGCSIEHIGSTAVPDLAAKPVIDIMAGVESLEAFGGALTILERYQYCYAPYRTEVMHGCANPHRRFARTTCIWSRLGARSGSSSWHFAITCAPTPMWLWNMPH
jgi:GrpB-like predicted nucleotidyltransferase (UPF0157 family)